MSKHNSSHADNVKIVFIYEVSDIDTIENCLKSVVKNYQYRKQKEIYEINLDTLKQVIRGCGDLVTAVKVSESLSGDQLHAMAFRN